MVLAIVLLSMSMLIYFLSRVCIQFSYICTLDLPMGMDLSKLYDEVYEKTIVGFVDHLIQSCAFMMFKFSKRFHIKA